MASVFHGLAVLVGAVCTALLTLGLVSDQPPTSASEPPPPAVTMARPALAAAEQAVVEPGVAAGPATWRTAVSGDHDSHTVALYRICRVTAYADRGTTASGVPSGLGQCAAPADIPFGSLVYISALDRTFIVTDRTHRRFRRSTVDIFIPSRRQCLNFGCRYLECQIMLPETSASGSTRD